MKPSKSLSALNQKYRGKPKKYAEGGRVRSPAAAPVASPFDAGYIERLAAQAVGAGEPVTEVRSSEGRGFAPMPRDASEALQRMSAVVRGDVEPTPEEERQISHVRGFTEGPAAIRAYHGSPYQFDRFDISKVGTGEGAQRYGHGLYLADLEKTAQKFRPQGGHMYEVNINTRPEDLLHYNATLNETSPEIIKAIEKNFPSAMDYWRSIQGKAGDSAGLITRVMAEDLGGDFRRGASEVSRILASEGVPGIRYIDPATLGTSNKAYNYVVFDPGLIEMVRRYADGGTVRAPKETYISGQEHKLAYITDREAALLKARGGSGRMTDYGVRAYDADPGGDAQGSDPGPDGPGPSTDTSTDPGPTTDSPGPRGGMSNEDPEGTPAAANMNTAVDAAREGRGVGIADTAGVSPTGFNAAPGIAEAIGAYSRGEISLAEAIGYGLQSGLAPPGVTPGISVNEIGVQTPAISVDPLGLGLGLVGMAVGVPGLGALGGRVGSAVSQALGVAPSVFSSNPNEGPAAPSDMGGGEYLQYGQTQYGLPTQTNVASSTAPTPAAPVVDWNQIQREANAMNMSVSDYLALKWRSPVAMARGGEVSLEEMEAKYAEGGEVYPPQGEVAYYDPDEIDRIARQIHLRFPEEDLVRPSSEDVESPSDLTMRTRLMMRGQNVGIPETVGMGGGNDRFTSSTSMRDIPIESEPYGTSQRMLNTSINAVLDAERNARIGAGMLALERSGERGFTGYGPQLSAGYGPASIYGGYQAITPNMPSAKSQGSYVYGGNLNIPIDESGTEANIGGTVMSGRRGQGSGPSGTQIMGSLERPLLGGRLALELAADPSLRHKEILLGYRRAF